MSPRRRIVVAVGVCWLAMLAAAAVAIGASSPSFSNLEITEVDTSGGETIRVGFTLDHDDSSAPDIKLAENDQEIDSVSVYSGEIGQYESENETVVVLAVDASESMVGEKLEKAKMAAASFANQANADQRIGLVSFGEGAKVELEPTTDRSELLDAIFRMKPSNGTATYDAVVEASGLFGESDSRNVIVLMSDGAELRSSATFDEAVGAARKADARVVTVGIVGRGFEPDALVELATPTGGTYHEAARIDDLETLYVSLGNELLRSWWLEYETLADPRAPVTLELGLEDEAPVETKFRLETVPGDARAPVVLPGPKPAATPDPFVELPGGLLGQLLVAVPFGLALASWYLLHKSSSSRLTPERIEPYIGADEDPSLLALEQRAAARGSLLHRLFAATEQRIGQSSRFARYQSMLDAAALPLRPVELFWARIAGAFLGASIGVLMGGLIGMGIGALVVSYLPIFVVSFRSSRRRKKFDAQLPDVLSTMASSLKAGHSFNQAMNAVIKEAGAPVSDEFQRAMTEASLGLPLDEALDQMATRLGSADLRFVVTTVNIQRTVGGSLAEILEMVGDTVRGRQQFRKKVKALTSMGRASMWVLLAMPFVMAMLLTLMKPEFMAPLWTTTIGHMMIGAALFQMFLGYMFCRKIVQVAI